MYYCFFDTETTGLKNSTIIELAGIVIDAEFNKRDTFNHLCQIDGGFVFEEHAQKVNKIKDADLVGKPSLKATLIDFFSFLQFNSVQYMFSHNAAFDVRHIAEAIERHELEDVPKIAVYDTVEIAETFIENDKHSLSALQTLLSIRKTASRHRALEDTEILIEVIAKICSVYKISIKALIEKRVPFLMHKVPIITGKLRHI